MPMKENEPFKRKEIRADLRDDEEVFYCSVTDEIFESYEEFCEQVLLVNSLIWSCSYTGKSGLTFEEAVASEEHVRSVMKDFPIELRIPVLYLGSITQRTSLENMAEDVFSFSKDRFFVGESVEVNFMGNAWCECHVIQVIEPTQDEIIANAAETKREQGRSRFESLPSSLFRYEVESLDEDTAWGGEQVVAAGQIRRRKGCYTRDKNRMYLQQFSEPGPNGVWKVKNDILVKHGVQRVKFENIFIGKPPVFQASTNVRKPAGAKGAHGAARATKQGTMDRYLTTSNNQNKKKSAAAAPAKRTPQKEAAQKVKEKYRNPGGVAKKYRKKEQMVMSVEVLQKLREQQKEEALEKRRKQVEEKVLQRAQLKEEKRRLAEFMKKWNQQREDLECEDLKPLPAPVAVQCRVPNEHFGHFLMILEFFHNFAEPLATKDSFPYGMTFDLVERALSEKEVAGPFSDMLQFLLSSLFFMQGEEDDEILDSKTVPDLDIDDNVDVTTSEAIQQATAAAGWSQQYQGTPLSKLPLDSVTVTEVLRLHLLSSGGEVNVKWRYQQRGGYTSRDDPGLQLRMQQPHILRALSVNTVFELPLADKLAIMTCLMDQILTYAALRDVVEESLEKYRVQRIELKVNQLSMMKREKELTTLRIKQRKEQRKLKGEPGAAPATGAPAPAVTPEEPEPVEMTEAELEERIGKLEKEMAKGLTEVQRKTADVNAIAAGHRVVPLGMDRAHRRFWVFNSCPGLFVENDPSYVGPCLAKPTPHNAAADINDTLTYVRRLFEEEKSSGGSDKENDVNADKKRPAPSPKKTRTESLRSDAEDVKASPHALVCSVSDGCAVHGCGVRRTKWSFFSKEEELEGLLSSLNCRGVRESELRHNLAEESKTIVKMLAKCPVQKLDQTQVDEAAPEERKNSRSTYAARYVDSNLNFPPNTDAAEIFELTLRDLIVDLEEKIQHGGLGSLKVNDRTEWRTAIIERKYDKQCDKLEWGGGQAKTESAEAPANPATARLNGRSSRGSRPATPAVEPVEVKQEPADVKQEPMEYKDPGKLLGQHEPAQNPVVRHLAGAILQLGQSLEKKYRQKPLVPDEDDWGQVERWEMSLMASTGLSQLFVHYYTLESSIQWSRSALNANCRLCRRRGDAENMLLCDSCNKGHHLYCLKPKLTKVPQGDWFCPKCRPEVKTPRAARKRRAIFVPDEEEADEDNELIEPAEGEPMFVEVCDTCGEGGHVICCDTAACGLVFHIECLTPPLKKVPRGKWYCPKCKAPAAAAHDDDRRPRASKDCEWQPKQQSPPVARSRRGCAAAAVAKISKFTKRIQSRASWEDDEEGEEEASSSTSALSDETQPSRRSARKSQEPDLDLPLNNAVLQDLLTEVMKHRDAWPFLRPVPKAQVPDYHIIIKRPMDLGTMKNKLNMLNYTNNSEFIADANLVFENCKMYNHYDAVEYKAGVRLRKFFEKRCNEMGIHLSLEELQDLEGEVHASETKRMDNGVTEENDTNEDEEENDDDDDDGEENTEQEDEEEEEEEEQDDDDERGEEEDDTVDKSEGDESESCEDEPLKKIPRISDD